MGGDTLKALTKMTRTKLIEEAALYPDIVGAHGMNKAQLIEVLTEAKKAAGEWVEEVEEKAAPGKIKKAVVDKGSIKKMIRELKIKRDEAISAGDRDSLAKARARIKKLKGRLRRIKVA